MNNTISAKGTSFENNYDCNSNVVHVVDNNGQLTGSLARTRISHSLLGVVLQIEQISLRYIEDEIALVDGLIQLANQLVASEIRASSGLMNQLPSLQKLGKGKGSLKGLYCVSAPKSAEFSADIRVLPFDMGSLNSLKAYYNSRAGEKMGELDPISLHGIRTIMEQNAGSLYTVALPAGEIVAVVLKDCDNVFSIIETMENSEKTSPDYIKDIFLYIARNSSLERIAFWADANSQNQSNFVVTYEGGLNQDLENLYEGVLRIQYSNIEEELVKLPKIFRETKNAPRFGVDY